MTDDRRIWASLRWRNYRIYIIGQSISLVGTVMQAAVVSWLLYRLTRSELTLWLYGFLREKDSVVVVLFTVC